MNIKLRAKLSAYSLVDTFESPSEDDHQCKLMTPVSNEQIERELFSKNEEESSKDVVTDKDFANFVDSLFSEE